MTKLERERERKRQYKVRHKDRVRVSAKVYRTKHQGVLAAKTRRYYETELGKLRQLLHKAKCRAKAKNLPFDLTIDDLFAPEFCPVLGIKLDYSYGTKGNKGPMPNSPSVDRTVPELGYVRGNVMVISMRANVIKHNATPDELMRVARFFALFG